MNHPIATLSLVVLFALIGCDSNSHLPKPRPPEDDFEPQPTEAAPTGPSTQEPTAQPLAVQTEQAKTAESPPKGPEQPTESDSGPLVIKLANPDSLRMEILPIEPSKRHTDAEKMQLSVKRMQKIAAAMIAYARDKGHIVPMAAYDDEKAPTLSWRVMLLPYLGHADLFKRFNLKEPFYSATNKPLLDLMPAVYQCPDRLDNKTNYLAPYASDAAFHPTKRNGCAIEDITDGLENTAILVEVDHSMAVEWTRPSDYPARYQVPRRGLQELRKDGFLFSWGNGEVAIWPQSVPDDQFGGLFTIAGNESDIRKFGRTPTVVEVVNIGSDPESPTPSVSTSATPELVAAEPQPSKFPVEPITESSANATSVQDDATNRTQPPDSSTHERLLAEVRDAYADEYQELRTSEERAEFVQRLVSQAKKSSIDPAEQFVLLEVARNVAAGSGDVIAAFEIINQISHTFEIEKLSMQSEVLDTTSRMPLDESNDELAQQMAERLIGEAMSKDRFDTAMTLHAAALSSARRCKDQRKIAQLYRRRDDIATARRQFEQVYRALDLVSNGIGTPTTYLTVGAYLCFVKGQWDRGLPLLADGSDSQISELAIAELAGLNGSVAQAEMAERWWEVSKANRMYRRGCQQRAEHWYREAIPGLSDGLMKVKAEMRLEQLEKL